MATLRDQFIEALNRRGEFEVASKSSKFIRLTRKEGGYYFIGKSGSLRFGRTLTTSIPVSDRLKRELIGSPNA